MKSSELFEMAVQLGKAETKASGQAKADLRAAKELVRKTAWAAWRKEKGK